MQEHTIQFNQISQPNPKGAHKRGQAAVRKRSPRKAAELGRAHGPVQRDYRISLTAQLVAFKFFMKERRTKGDGEVGDGEVGRWGDLVYARWHGNNVVMAVHSSAGKTRWNCDSHVTSGWCYVPRVLCTEFQFCVKNRRTEVDYRCWNPTVFLLFHLALLLK